MCTGLSRLIMPAVLAMLATPLSAAGQIETAAEGPNRSSPARIAADPQPRRPGTRDRPRRSPVGAAAHRRPARRSDLPDVHPASDSSRWSRTAANRPPRGPRSGSSTTATTSTSTFRAWESQPDRMIANEMRRDSSNIRQSDSVGFALRHVPRPPQRVQFEPTRSAAAPTARAPTSASPTPTGIRSGTCAAGRFEGGWTIEAAIPFKSIRYAPGRRRIGASRRAARTSGRTRLRYLTRVPPAFGLGRGRLLGVAVTPRWSASRRRRLSRNLELKPYVDRRSHHRQHRRRPRRSERSGRRRRRRREVRRHPEPDRRPHLQHRLRAGRGRRAAGEPDAVQPVLSREARVLPGEPGHLHLRQQRLGRRPTRTPPTCRSLFYSRRIGLDGQSRACRSSPAAGSPGGSAAISSALLNIQTREDTTADARRRTSRSSASSATSCAAAASACSPPRRSKSQIASRLEPGLRRRRHVRVLQQPAFDTYCGQDPDRRPRRRRHQLPGADGLRRRPLRPAARAPDGRSDELQSRGRVPAARPTSARTTARSASARGRVDQRRSGSSRIGAVHLHRGWRRPADDAADSTASSRIEFQNSDRFSVGVNEDYELTHAAVRVVPGRAHPGRRLRFTTGRIGYKLGQQRPCLGQRAGRARAFYDGDRTAVTFNRAARQRLVAAVARAERVGQLDRRCLPARFTHDAAGLADRPTR